MSHRARQQRSAYTRRGREESDEVALLRARHAQSLTLLNEIFPDWSDEDLLYTLKDCQGDFELAVARISEGFATQWGEVKTRKVKKEPAPTSQVSKPQARVGDDKKPRSSSLKPERNPKGENERKSSKNTYRTDENGTLIPSKVRNLPGENDSNNLETNLSQSVKPIPQNTWASRIAKANSQPGPSHSAKDNKPRPKTTKNSQESGWDETINQSNGAKNPFDDTAEYISNNEKDGWLQESFPSTIPAKSPPVETPKPKPAPTNSWAKIASRASQPKPSPKPEPAPVEVTTQPDQPEIKPVETVPEVIQEQSPDLSHQEESPVEEEKVEEPQPEEEQPQESKSSLQTGEISLDDVMASLLEEKATITNPKEQTNSGLEQISQIDAVVLPGTIAAKMDGLSKKFSSFDATDYDDITPQTYPEAENHTSVQQRPAQAPIRQGPPGIAPPGITPTGIAPPGITPPGLATSTGPKVPPGIPFGPPGIPAGTRNQQRPSTQARQGPFVAELASNNLAETAPQVEQKHQDPVPVVHKEESKASEPSPENIAVSSPAEQNNTHQDHRAHAQQGYPQPQVIQGQSNGGLSEPQPQDPQNIQQAQQGQQQYYPGHEVQQQQAHGLQPHMQHQGMPQPHQGQNNYMPYYGQFNYGPSHYNPYQNNNNYTLQFAQKSLAGGYGESPSNAFGHMTPNAVNPQDPNSYNPNYQGAQNNHVYDKNAQNKTKGYEASSAEQTNSHQNGPMNYGMFGYGNMPYQPQGTPHDGSVYYQHPYYPQPNQQQMFGYPQNQQHIPPHLQQQMQGYPHQQNQHAHYQQQNHQQQGHQQQQGNPNARYQNWNN